MKITSKQLVLFIAHEFAAYTSDVEKQFGITKEQALRVLHKCPGVGWDDVNGNWAQGMKSNKIWQIEGDEQHMTDDEAVAYITDRKRDPNEVLFDSDKSAARKTVKASIDVKMTAKSHPKEYMAWVRSFKATNKSVIKL